MYLSQEGMIVEYKRSQSPRVPGSIPQIFGKFILPLAHIYIDVNIVWV